MSGDTNHPPALPHHFHLVVHHRTVKPSHSFQLAGLARLSLCAHFPVPTGTQKTTPPPRPPVQLRHVIRKVVHPTSLPQRTPHYEKPWSSDIRTDANMETFPRNASSPYLDLLRYLVPSDTPFLSVRSLPP